MSRSFYIKAIFFLVLSLVCGLFQAVIHLLLGNQVYFLQPFVHWFLFANIISLVSTLFLLRYFKDSNYRFAFWAGVIAAIVMTFQFVLNYVALLKVMRELERYAIMIAVPYFASGLLLAVSLILSPAGRRPWLRAAGVYMFMMYLVFACAIVLSITSREFVVGGMFEKIQQWASLAANVIPVCLWMNFRSELRALPADEVHAYNNSFGWWSGVGILAVVLALILGLPVARESFWAIEWRKRSPEVAQQLAKPFDARIYVSEKGDTLHYLLLKPIDYDAQNEYPIVVCLHGGPIKARPGERPHVEVAEPAPSLSSAVNRKKYPAFVLVPQGPPGFTWGGIPRYPSVDSLVFETMQELEAEFSIDVKRRYVAGGSMGGYGTWHFIGSRPEMFAAALPYCGAGDPSLARNMVGVPVWAFHGRKDRNVSVNGSRDMIDAIKEAGGNPLYTEFPETGHHVWPEIDKTPGVLDWMFAQERD